MGPSKSSTYFHAFSTSFTSFIPVSLFDLESRPTRVGGRRTQGLSRSAVALVWGPRSQALIFTHSPLLSLPSYQFLCSTWNPVSSPRPTRVGGRRTQGLSRSAVALAWRHAQSFPGRALTAPSTAARLSWSG